MFACLACWLDDLLIRADGLQTVAVRGEEHSTVKAFGSDCTKRWNERRGNDSWVACCISWICSI